jgi:hypothetical protein
MYWKQSFLVKSRLIPRHRLMTTGDRFAMKSIATQPIIVSVPETTVSRYSEASEEVEQMLGASPGPEFLMSLAVEHEDAFELVDLFCGEIIDALREPNAATH